MAAVIRFPPPPPTRNHLSSEQRAKLIRTNNKLGQVLGSTPHVLDLSSYVIPVAPKEDLPSRPKTPTASRNPFRTHSRSKSAPKVDADTIRTITMSPDSTTSSSSDASRKSNTSVRMKRDELAWRSPYPMQRPPLLQLSVPSPSRRPKLDTIPGSPPADHTDTAPISIEPPNFSLPSEAAIRREKMRRVRKMLGDGVPTDLVFPSSPEESESESESEQDSPMVATPTSTISREWLLVNHDKPLPDVFKPLPKPMLEEATQPTGKASVPAVRRNLLFKKPNLKKDKPSKGAKRLDSIVESAKESRPESIQVLGVSASAGMGGIGKSRRFVEGDIPFDQIGTPWGGAGRW